MLRTRSTFWLLAAPLAAFAFAVPAFAQAAADEATVNAFAFSPADHGLAVGEAGLVLATDDGGKNWTRRDSGTAASLLAVAYADPRVAYAVGGANLGAGNGSTGLILKSGDGGFSWHAVGQPGRRCWGLSTRGDAVCVFREPGPDAPSGLLLSRDAGKNWEILKGRLDVLPLAMRWSDDTSGRFLDAAGAVWRWEKDEVTPLENQSPPGRAAAACFLDADVWLLALERGQVVRTDDAGHTWRPVAVEGAAGGCGVRNFCLLGGDEAWLVGVGPGGVQYTSNGGRSFKRTGPSPAGPLRAVHFTDSWTGLAAGPFGAIYRTIDGGGAWTCVRGAPRRPALWVVEPWAAVGDWPLVSMLSGDRGYRTLLWAATNPADESILAAERRLRDAAAALGSAEAVVLARDASARLDGSPGFQFPATMPHGAFAAKDPSPLAAALAEAARLWRPAVILSPSPAADDAEAAFVARAVDLAAAPENRPAGPPLRRWLADPRNESGSRPPGSDGGFEVSVPALSPSENFGVYHAVRGVMAADLLRRWPAPLAETLGYQRLDAAPPKHDPTALLGDLDRGDAETRRSVGPAAAVGFEKRLDWEREARNFYPQLNADLAGGNFADAWRRALELAQTRAELQLPQECLAEVGRRAALGGDPLTAERALAAAATVEPTWGPRSVRALLWLMDRQAALEWRAGELAPPLPTKTAPPDYMTMFSSLERLAPGLSQRPDLAYQRYRYLAAQAKIDDAALARIRRQVEAAPPAGWPGCDAILAREVKLETWVQSGRHGDPPVAWVRLEAVQSGQGGDGAAVDLAEGLNLKVRERADGLIMTVDAKPAAEWWITVDMDRDGRTWLAEPLAAEANAPDPAATGSAAGAGTTGSAGPGGAGPAALAAPTLVATAGDPLWVRRGELWVREEKDGRLALFLNYGAIGGRPQRGTVWLLTLRQKSPAGLRPAAPAGLKNAGCFAVLFD